MDVDAVLTRAPRVALVDELAHTNIPGSRNEKRWQDVQDLIDAGIDAVSVTLIVGVTKFTIGAWVPIVVVPVIIVIFRAIKGHYERLGTALTITPEDVRRQDLRHTVVVLVGRIHRGVVTALNYARSAPGPSRGALRRHR